MKLRSFLKRSRLFNFNVINRDRWIAEQAASVVAGSRVLDVGAGSCPYRSLFSHCNYQTQDVGKLEDHQLRHGGYGRIDYVGDATSIPAHDGEFDVILCTEMLEHHPEPIQVVKEFGRLLRPGGLLILTAPLGSGIHQEPYHFYGGYTPYWYERFLRDAGFVTIEVTPNAGFFSHFGQESLRFLQLSAPWRRDVPAVSRLIWAPAWLLLLPILGIGIPMLSIALDHWDKERRFTVGYHVRALRQTESA
ncbi:MAG: class I SAM-dependent methyltransferase [Thiobacillaceae bacterium]